MESYVFSGKYIFKNFMQNFHDTGQKCVCEGNYNLNHRFLYIEVLNHVRVLKDLVSISILEGIVSQCL